MKMPAISLLEWQNKFGNERACTKLWPRSVGLKVFNAHRGVSKNTVLWRVENFINVLGVIIRFLQLLIHCFMLRKYHWLNGSGLFT